MVCFVPKENMMILSSFVLVCLYQTCNSNKNIMEIQTINFTVGRNVELKCSCNTSESIADWYRNGTKVNDGNTVSDDFKTRFQIIENDKLLIINTTQMDATRYKCETAENNICVGPIILEEENITQSTPFSVDVEETTPVSSTGNTKIQRKDEVTIRSTELIAGIAAAGVVVFFICMGVYCTIKRLRKGKQTVVTGESNGRQTPRNMKKSRPSIFNSVVLNDSCDGQRYVAVNSRRSKKKPSIDEPQLSKYQKSRPSIFNNVVLNDSSDGRRYVVVNSRRSKKKPSIDEPEVSQYQNCPSIYTEVQLNNSPIGRRFVLANSNT